MNWDRLKSALQAAAAEGTGVDLPSPGPLRVDSRRIQPGDIFVALPGRAGRHGQAFATDAVDRGAVAVLSDTPVKDVDVPVYVVPNLEQQLYDISARYTDVDWNRVRVVAVTGTNGKTSVTSQLRYAADRLGLGGCYIGTIRYEGPGWSEAAIETTPHFVDIHRLLHHWQANCRELLLGLEASSHALEQQRLGRLPVDVCVVTNIGHDHLDYHGSMAAYHSAKAQIFQQPAGTFAEAAVLDPHDLEGEYDYGDRSVLKVAVDGDLWATCTAVSAQQLDVAVHWANTDYSFSFHAMGRYQADNGGRTFGALLALGYDPARIAEALDGWAGAEGRMQLVIAEPFLGYVDYAHTPDALRAALLSARELVAEGARLICVFGCGGDRDRDKRPQMAAIAEVNADVVVVTSDNPRSESAEAIIAEVVAGAQHPQQIKQVADRAAAIRYAVEITGPGDVLLVAGKGHETGQTVADRTLPFDDREELQRWCRR